jgi:hypothetical protein
MTIRYRFVDGEVRKEILASPGRRRQVRGENRPQHFSRTLLNAYYQLECDHKFRSVFTKNRIKRTHDEAIQRAEYEGQKYEYS